MNKGETHMKVKVNCIVDLPLKFLNRNDFKKAKLTKEDFYINDVYVKLITQSDTGIIDKVKIEFSEEYDENNLPSYEHMDYLSDFHGIVSFKAGTAMQDFLDGFSRSTNDEYYQIFDGEDFVTPYEFNVSPNILQGSGNTGNSQTYLDDDILNKSIDFANKKKNMLDIAWYLLRDAEHAMELGKYEISIIYMAITTEMLVTSALSEFLDDYGIFIDPYKKEINNIYGGRPSFVEKYFEYGLTLKTDKKMPEDLLGYVDFIYRIRNKLAHGRQIYDIDLIKENEINEYNIRDHWRDFHNKIIDVHNWFFDLNEDLRIFSD
ncbi:MAG: hypothetical protein KBH09_15555 [Saprospiraceae bacterium]|nr:hypothetical protein [Saprospiraceae bacterium]